MFLETQEISPQVHRSVDEPRGDLARLFRKVCYSNGVSAVDWTLGILKYSHLHPEVDRFKLQRTLAASTLSYSDFLKGLEVIGVELSELSVTVKSTRGTFTTSVAGKNSDRYIRTNNA